jgi:RNA polymerase sigma-70 factor, ECF subfamily
VPADPVSSQPSDADLVAAITAGHVAGSRHFETLYHRHRDWVYRLALRFCSSHDEALDVTQETFIYLLGKLKPQQVSRDPRTAAAPPAFQLTSKLTTFLYPAVKHIALARRRRKAPKLAGDEVLDRAAPDDAPPNQRDLPQLAAALSGLSDVHREAVLMRFVDGMSMDEMSAALDIPVGTVKSRLHNAIAALKADPRTRAYFLGERE